MADTRTQRVVVARWRTRPYPRSRGRSSSSWVAPVPSLERPSLVIGRPRERQLPDDRGLREVVVRRHRRSGDGCLGCDRRPRDRQCGERHEQRDHACVTTHDPEAPSCRCGGGSARPGDDRRGGPSCLRLRCAVVGSQRWPGRMAAARAIDHKILYPPRHQRIACTGFHGPSWCLASTPSHHACPPWLAADTKGQEPLRSASTGAFGAVRVGSSSGLRPQGPPRGTGCHRRGWQRGWQQVPRFSSADRRTTPQAQDR